MYRYVHRVDFFPLICAACSWCVMLLVLYIFHEKNKIWCLNLAKAKKAHIDDFHEKCEFALSKSNVK